MKKYLLLLVTSSFFLINLNSQQTQYPLIGAQVFIEPGQTSGEIDHWFKTLSDNQMPVCRIRLFENYCRDENGNWDFNLFDKAFNAAAKYDVKVFVTLFPVICYHFSSHPRNQEF